MLVAMASVWHGPSARATEFSRPFGDFMVLPHGQPIPVWGIGEPGAMVTLQFAEQSKSTRCDESGRWRLMLAAEKPCDQGRDLVLVTNAQRVSLKEVLVGEVWLCSGQSNMDFTLAKATGGRAEAARAENFPQIRLFNLTGVPTDSRAYETSIFSRLNTKDHFTGKWAIASEASAAEFSALAWWTAKIIHLQKGIPIGVVENAVGGSGMEAWLPRETLKSRADYQPLLGAGWLDCPQISAWARARARLNLADKPMAMHPFQPGFLFESGLREWSTFPFSGVLWYQGETNAEIADRRWNERMIHDLVVGWRSALKRETLPFFMVELPRIGGKDPLRAHWPEFRQAQARAAHRLTDVHLIATQDLGWDSPDVHPPDKLPVAQRLAAAVLNAKSR